MRPTVALRGRIACLGRDAAVTALPPAKAETKRAGPGPRKAKQALEPEQRLLVALVAQRLVSAEKAGNSGVLDTVRL